VDKQSSSAHWTRKAAWGLGGVSGILLAVWIAPFVSFFLGSAPKPLAFDSETWSARGREDLQARGDSRGSLWLVLEVAEDGTVSSARVMED
jgi:hypothetical protein